MTKTTDENLPEFDRPLAPIVEISDGIQTNLTELDLKLMTACCFYGHSSRWNDGPSIARLCQIIATQHALRSFQESLKILQREIED